MTSESILNIEGGHINRQRIAVNSQRVPYEYFCPICGYLLWKPRSCASCQHLFCLQCIKSWLNTDATSCPFRCTPYEERRAPPHLQSLLASLPIRCRNTSFGCTEVLSYDSLEQHENVECKFLTRRCRMCEELLPVDRIDQHQMVCTPTVIRCSLCHCAVQRTFFQTHYDACRQQKVNQLQRETLAVQNDANSTVATSEEPIAQNWFITAMNQGMKEGSRLPTINLPGIQQVFQARRHGYIAHTRAILILFWLNLSTAPHILRILLQIGICMFITLPVTVYLIFQKWINASIYRASALIIVLSGLFSFGLPLLFQCVTDTVIITFLTIIVVLLGTTNMFVKLDSFQMSLTQMQTALIDLAFFVIFKITLLFMRFYFSHIPPYVTATCLAWIAIFLVFHNRRGFAGT